MLASDVGVLDELIAPELMFTAPTGQIMDKSADLETHRSGTLKLQRIDVRDRRIQLWENCAVVSVEAHLEGTFGGQQFAGDFCYLRVWMRRGDQWQIIAGQATSLAV